MRWLGLVMVAGCTVGGGDKADGSGDDTDSGGTDTGTLPVGTCPADADVLEMRLCLETTAPGYADSDVTYTQDTSGRVSGTVVEAGPWSAGDAATAVSGFGPCWQSQVEGIVRIVDDAGETWTVGWSIEGDAEADSYGLFSVGEELTVDWASWFGAYEGGSGVAISDASGLRYVFDIGLALASEQTGVDVTFGDECTYYDVEGDFTSEYTLTALVFDGTVSLHSGESGTVSTDADELDVVVPFSGWNQDCTDGCGTSAWAGWR